MNSKTALQEMKSFAASDVKTKIGAMFVAAAKEPVLITKRGALRFVLEDEYRRLEAIEDAHWAARAHEALKSGFVGADKAERLLREALAPGLLRLALAMLGGRSPGGIIRARLAV